MIQGHAASRSEPQRGKNGIARGIAPDYRILPRWGSNNVDEKRGGHADWPDRPLGCGALYFTSDAREFAALAVLTLRHGRSKARPLLAALQLPAQPVAGHVQPALDRADGRLELAAHLLERTAVNVKRHQRLLVDRLEALQARPHFLALFGLEHV